MDSSSSPAAAPTLSSIALRYGVLTGLISVVFSLILFLTKTDQSGVRWLGTLISAGGIYLAHVQFKKHNGGFLEYGQGLKLGVLLSLVAALISSVFFIFYTTVVDTGYTAHMMEVTRTQMEAKGTMSEEQIEQAMSITSKFMTTPAMFGFGLLIGVFSGFIVSLIVSAITKNSRPEFE